MDFFDLQSFPSAKDGRMSHGPPAGNVGRMPAETARAQLVSQCGGAGVLIRSNRDLDHYRFGQPFGHPAPNPTEPMGSRPTLFDFQPDPRVCEESA